MDCIVRTTAGIDEVCGQARRCGYLSLDTEFVWRCTYRPQLGIVQVGTDSYCKAIDCRVGMDVSGLGAVIADAGVVKILHDARQDLALLRHYAGTSPENVFDTQLAAAFVGFPGKLGLQKLLFEAIGIGLPKTETCTDWTRRPLSDAQVRYALDDVRYLSQLRDELLRRAGELGTRAWLEEELANYAESELSDDLAPDQMWKRVKLGRARLDRCAFAVLRAVAAVREDTAREWNLPRSWLGDDSSLVAMAASRKVERIVHRLRGWQGDAMRARYAAAVAAALDTPEEDWPEDPRVHYIQEVLKAADEALEWLGVRAEEIHVDAGVIASRATVTAYVDNVDDETNPLACGWRYEAVGREMAERFGVE